MKKILTVLALASTALAQEGTEHKGSPPPKDKQHQETAPDNTGKNATQQLTAEEQGGSESDRETTKNIRRELMKNDSLTSTAKNVKVITIGGKVTLRGPVHSEQEKTAVAAAAEKMVGKGKVTNQLEVKKSH